MWRKIAEEIFYRYIFAVDIIIIIIFAAFIAAAIDQLISGRIDSALIKYREKQSSSPKSSLKYKVGGKGSSAGAIGFTPVDGNTILARNFFDSVTGPLDESAYELADFGQEDAFPGQTVDDLSSMPPKCSAQIKIVGLFASEDPEWAFAAVESNNKTEIKGIGDTIQSFRINDITWKYLFLGQQGSSSSCYLDIWQEEIAGGGKPVRPGLGKIGAAVQKVEPGTGSPEDKKNFQSMINGSISDVSPTEKDIDKSLVDYLVQNKQMLMQSGRILPNIENEEINGFKVYGIRKTSLWGKLGVQNGDIIHSVNGIAFTGPDAALQAFGNLQGSDHLTVNVTRRGKNMNLDFNIK